MPKFNKEPLLQVKQVFLDNPERLLMDTWLVKDKPGSMFDDDYFERQFPVCGTVGCIAGWIKELAGDYAEDSLAPTSANNVLGLKHTDTKQLFHVPHWPEKFSRRWIALDYRANNIDIDLMAESIQQILLERAQLVGEVIDDFIKTIEERELSNAR